MESSAIIKERDDNDTMTSIIKASDWTDYSYLKENSRKENNLLTHTSRDDATHSKADEVM